MALALGEQDGILKKLVTVVAAPAPQAYFLRHRSLIPEGQERRARDDRAALARRLRGLHPAVEGRGAARFQPRRGRRRSRACRPITSLPGTTRRCARCASIPSITYLQVRYPRGPWPLRACARILAQIRRRGDRPSRVHPLQRPHRIRGPAAGALHDRGAAAGDHGAITRRWARRSSIRTATRSRRAA